MGFWKKIRVMVLIGLGIFTISSSGESGELNLPVILNHPIILSEFAKIIEDEVESVSKVSNISSGDLGHFLYFTVRTTNGDILEDFVCTIFVITAQDISKSIIRLTDCGNSVAKFEKQHISISIEKIAEVIQSDSRTQLK